MSKLIDLAKKIKALADKGIGGEKVNAETMLIDFMHKHGIEPSDLEDEFRSEYEFRYGSKEQLIMVQSILKVMGKAVKIYGYRGKRNAVFIECSVSEFVEINSISDFYYRHYENELKIFNTAFIHKNGLLPFDAGTADESDMSEEDRQKLKSMYEGIEAKRHLKQIEK